MNDIYNGLKSNKFTSGLFLNVRKGFDTVDHEILLNKLFRRGIRGITHEWFISYLLERHQSVKIESEYSDMGKILQGTVLS